MYFINLGAPVLALLLALIPSVEGGFLADTLAEGWDNRRHSDRGFEDRREGVEFDTPLGDFRFFDSDRSGYSDYGAANRGYMDNSFGHGGMGMGPYGGMHHHHHYGGGYGGGYGEYGNFRGGGFY